jgi:hypothetical protein
LAAAVPAVVIPELVVVVLDNMRNGPIHMVQVPELDISRLVLVVLVVPRSVVMVLIPMNTHP